MIDEKMLQRDIHDYMIKRVDNLWDDALDALLEINADLAGIIGKQPKVGEWIPCSERLPKQGEQVICTLVSARGHRFVTQEQFFPNLLKEPFPMVAWMPLPAQYREDGEE